MFEQQIAKDVFMVLYGGAAVLSLVACCYLLFRRGNAFAPEITSPLRLRRWTAALFAAMTLSHAWYFPMYVQNASDHTDMCYIIGGLLDFLTVIPLAIIVLLAMLQDYKRPLWPVALAVAPLVLAGILSVRSRSLELLPYVYGYFLLMCTGILIYMVRATRRYGRWLRDNYADLEHKEVWQSLVVLGTTLLAFVFYTFGIGGQAHEYLMQVFDIVLICYFLWRTETLSDLSTPAHDDVPPARQRSAPAHGLSRNIGPLLTQYCEQQRLYLQGDISLSELAKQIGVNRVYLSKHFASQGTTYNAYINGLRIQHFINLYQKAAQNHQPITVQQLAYKSGFRTYGTFNSAFKQSTGMTATEWMRDKDEQYNNQN